MEIKGRIGPSMSFSSSESSGFAARPYANYVLMDPRTNLDMPTYLLADEMEPIVGNNSRAWSLSIMSLRRGLLLLRTLSNLHDTNNLEMLGVLNIIRSSLENLKSNTQQIKFFAM